MQTQVAPGTQVDWNGGRYEALLTPRETGVLAWGGTDIREDPGAHRGRLHFIGHSDALKPVLSAHESLAALVRAER